MKAYILREPGTADALEPAELPLPVITDNEVLVKVKAIGINPVDVKTRKGQGFYPKMKQGHDHLVLGWDVSGVVEETDAQVTQFKKGDAVFGMVNFPGHGNAYAEYVAAPANHLAKKPANVSYEEAAATTLAALTAWQALMTHAQIKVGDKVVIQAAAGGVGHFAVQIAKNAGAYVIGTSSPGNRDFILELGADEHIDYTRHRIDEVINDADLVIDAIGGDNILPSLHAVKKGGTVIMLPSVYREQLATAAKETGVNGFVFLVESNGADMQQLASLLEKGQLHPHISATYLFDEIRDAHRQVESGKTKGKVVVVIQDPAG